MSAEYLKLKSLLLQEEIDKIDTLARDIKSLEDRQEKDVLVERLSQIITDILSKSLQANHQKLYATLQPLISKGVVDELHKSHDELNKILFPIITTAIHEQVHKQKESIVDALYPIMGNMISKYVSSAFTDMMHEINSKLQSSLSFSRVTRKIKSKLYGISEAQLLMQETDFVDIETIFLIHKESGLLIVDLHKEDSNQMLEVEMVASMLSAIRSFVNDWISQDHEMSEIREIEYSNSSISIESAGSCYLAVVTSSHADMKDKLSKVLARVVSKHSQELTDFDGDTQSIDMYSIKNILSTLFDKKDTTKEKFPILSFLVLIMLLMLPLGWYGYNSYQDYQAEQKEKKVVEILKANKIQVFDLDVHTTKENKILLDGVVMFDDDREKIDIVLRGYDQINRVRSIDENFYYNLKITKMKKVIAETNIKYNSNIEYKLSRNKIIFSGTIFDTKAKKDFVSQVENIFDDKKLLYKIETLPLLDKRIYFDLRSSDVLEKYYALLDDISLSLKNNKNYRVEIVGYTDLSGSKSYNKKLSRKRVVNTQNQLLLRGVDKEMLILKAKATPPKDLINVKSEEEQSLARCVIINWESISEK